MTAKTSFPARGWVNGRLVDPRRPALSVFDHGFLYGDGIYETLRVYNGQLFHFDEHMRRFQASAKAVRMTVPLVPAALRAAAGRLLAANRLKEAVLRITLTRGPGPMGFDPTPCRTPTLLMTALPAPERGEAFYRRGLKVAVVRVRRNSRLALDPAIKSTNNLNNILAKMESLARGADEALMLNIEGHLAEGTISNVFFVAAGTLKTPSLDCGLLAGVTRAAVIELAKQRGWTVVEGRFRPRDLFAAREVFLTSTTLEVVGVHSLVDEDGATHRVAGGTVGAWTENLRQDYRRLVAKETGAKAR